MPICGGCNHRFTCLVEPLLDTKFYLQFQSAIRNEYSVDVGDYIFKQGTDSGSLYLLKSGSIKMVMAMPNGVEKVLGFAHSWRLTGAAAACSSFHVYSAIALEKVRVCELDYQKVSDIMFLCPDFHKKFLALVMDQMIVDTQFEALIASGSVERRTASFLYSQVLHRQKNGLSISNINLSMPRSDISQFLSVSVESLSRGLSSLVKKRVIDVHNRQVSIIDIVQLKAIAEGVDEEDYSIDKRMSSVVDLPQVEMFSK